MILRTLVVTLAGLVTVPAVADTGAVEGATDIDDGADYDRWQAAKRRRSVDGRD